MQWASFTDDKVADIFFGCDSISYPCQSVSQWLIVSDLEIASPSFPSLFRWKWRSDIFCWWKLMWLLGWKWSEGVTLLLIPDPNLSFFWSWTRSEAGGEWMREREKGKYEKRKLLFFLGFLQQIRGQMNNKFKDCDTLNPRFKVEVRLASQLSGVKLATFEWDKKKRVYMRDRLKVKARLVGR